MLIKKIIINRLEKIEDANEKGSLNDSSFLNILL